jgi:hypothetical protein
LITLMRYNMPRKPDSGRIMLGPAANEVVGQMMAALRSKEECIRITPSSLVSWIVEQYLENGFEVDRDAIIKRHFNPKEYLKRVINAGGTPDEVASALEKALHKIRSEEIRPRSSRRRQTAKTSGEVTQAPSGEPRT